MNTKKIFTILSLSLLSFVSAQSLSDYKYIVVPTKFKDFDPGEYKLNNQLSNQLKSKKYIVLQENQESWPAEVFQNPCTMLRSDVLNNSNMLRNRLILQFKDCRNTITLEVKESSSYKEFDKGFQDALQKTFAKIPVSNPVSASETAIQDTQIKENISAKISESKTGDLVQKTENATQKAESYTNAGIIYQKVNIGNGQFILVSSGSSTPFATFSNSTKSDVYRIILQNGSMTLGYLENGNLVVEMPNADGTFRKEIFLVK